MSITSCSPSLTSSARSARTRSTSGFEPLRVDEWRNGGRAVSLPPGERFDDHRRDRRSSPGRTSITSAFSSTPTTSTRAAGSGKFDVVGGPSRLWGAPRIRTRPLCARPGRQRPRAAPLLGSAAMDFRTESIADLATRVRAKLISARELVQATRSARIDAVEPSGQRVRRGRRGRGPRRSGGDRRAHRTRRRPGSARRHPDRRQGPRGCGGVRHDARLTSRMPTTRRRGRQHPRGQAEGEGLRRPRQDEHTRVRMEGGHAERGVRRDPQPVGPGAVRRWVVGRHGRRLAVGRFRSRPDRTAAARSASRRRSTACRA